MHYWCGIYLYFSATPNIKLTDVDYSDDILTVLWSYSEIFADMFSNNSTDYYNVS